MADAKGLMTFKRRSDGQPWVVEVLVKDTDATLAQFPASPVGATGTFINVPADSGGVDLIDFSLATNTATPTKVRPIRLAEEKQRNLLTAFLSASTATPLQHGQGLWSWGAGEAVQVKAYA